MPETFYIDRVSQHIMNQIGEHIIVGDTHHRAVRQTITQTLHEIGNEKDSKLFIEQMYENDPDGK